MIVSFNPLHIDIIFSRHFEAFASKFVVNRKYMSPAGLYCISLNLMNAIFKIKFSG